MSETDLTGTTALVTGGGGGLGQVTCRALARAGADIVVTYKSGEARAEAVCDEIRGTTSKAGQIHLTRCLAVALAPDVTVNCVAPGLMEGTLLTANIPEAFADSFRNQSVLGRTTSLDDVAAQIVTYCISTSVTGQTAVIDGGVFFH